jgi:DDE superfamily endonuclease
MIHLVVDSLDIHCEKSLTDHFGRQTGRRLWRRLTVHYTPKHGSWLKQAEIELSFVARQCLGIRRIAALPELTLETRAWNARANRHHTRIRWTFARRDARKTFNYKANLSTRSET